MAELTAEEIKRWAEIIGKPAGAHKTQLEQWCVTASGLLLQLLQAQTWKPIETAPKDGTLVDLWIAPAKGIITSTGPVRCPECWHSNGKWWRYDEQYGDNQCRSEVRNATHWRSIPLPPLKEQGE